jgi:hypothetical protein
MNPAANGVAEYCAEKSSGSDQKNTQHVISSPPDSQKQKPLLQ